MNVNKCFHLIVVSIKEGSRITGELYKVGYKKTEKKHRNKEWIFTMTIYIRKRIIEEIFFFKIKDQGQTKRGEGKGKNYIFKRGAFVV